MKKEFKIQISKERYFDGGYDHLKRFISYFYQINLVRKLKPEKALEIGIGNKTVANYLKQQGVSIETCDFDEELGPDYVADIRELPFQDNSYDLVLACEILEHLPWEDVDKALREIRRVTKKYAIISIPYAMNCFELIVSSPLIEKWRKGPFRFLLKLPVAPKDIKFTGEHYWEMGRKSYPYQKVRGKFEEYFRVVKEVSPMLDAYRHIFVLEKKDI